MKLEVNEEELKSLTVKVCKLGESMGIDPSHFSIMLSRVATYLCEANGVEITAVNKEQIQ